MWFCVGPVEGSKVQVTGSLSVEQAVGRFQVRVSAVRIWKWDGVDSAGAYGSGQGSGGLVGDW